MIAFVVASCGGPPAPAPVTTPVANHESPVATVSKPPVEGMGMKLIQRTEGGGVIQLEGDRATAMDQANLAMVKHCGMAAYTITQEGEEAIESTSEMVRPKVAWRVHYECNAPAKP